MEALLATGLDDREMIEIASETEDWEGERRMISRSDLNWNNETSGRRNIRRGSFKFD